MTAATNDGVGVTSRTRDASPEGEALISESAVAADPDLVAAGWGKRYLAFVARLVEDGAKVEIEATAVIPDQ